MAVDVAGADAMARATHVVAMIRDGRYAEVESLFGERLRAQVSADDLRMAWQGVILQRGAVTGLGDAIIEPCNAGLTLVSIPVMCENGGFTVVQTFDDAGTVQGLRLAPPLVAEWAPPAYARPRRFTEEQVVLNAVGGAVPGTLSMPRGSGRHPAVVLLSGGGPFDRDETHGPNKPLKDLAWGLASKGLAVLRFDKVTHADPKLTARPHFTMTDEYVPHALAAIRLLREHPGIDPSRVYVLGHSMGGKVAPRVAAAEPSVAGLVILAGDTRPMQRSALRVARYLADLNPGPEADKVLETLAAQVERVESDDLSPATPASELPYGYSGAFWLDLRDYDPASVAAEAGKPMLILQGGRDYQVTEHDDLAGWRAGLAHRPDVVVRVFEHDDHLFFPGTGPSTPTDYEAPQHVDPEAVTAIAHWLRSGGRPGTQGAGAAGSRWWSGRRGRSAARTTRP